MKKYDPNEIEITIKSSIRSVKLEFNWTAAIKYPNGKTPYKIIPEQESEKHSLNKNRIYVKDGNSEIFPSIRIPKEKIKKGGTIP